MSGFLPYDEIRLRLLRDLDGLVAELFGVAPRSGTREIRIGAKGSIAVVRSGERAGLWRDYDGGAHQGSADVVGLVAYALTGDAHRRRDAFEWAARRYGIEGMGFQGKGLGPFPSPLPVPFPAHGQGERFTVVAVHLPVPADAPAPRFPRRHRPVGQWHWTDALGRLLLVTYRIEWPAGGAGVDKAVLPLTWCTVHDREGDRTFRAWWMRGLPAGVIVPVLGLDELLRRPDAPVLVVEGEKTRGGAAQHFPGYVVVTWLGGSARVAYTDWRVLAGRRVALWPDADPVNPKTGRRAGLEAMCAVAGLIAPIAASVSLVGARDLVHGRTQLGTEAWIAGPAGGLFDLAPPKWDLADELPSGWSASDLERLIAEALAWDCNIKPEDCGG